MYGYDNTMVSELNLRALIEHAPIGMCLLRGPEHRFQVVNTAYTHIIGGRDVVGLTVREALPEVVAQGFVELLDNVYATGETIYGNEVPVQLDDGSGKLEERFFNLTFHTTLDEAGSVDGIVTYAVDVTELVRTKAALAAAQKS